MLSLHNGSSSAKPVYHDRQQTWSGVVTRVNLSLYICRKTPNTLSVLYIINNWRNDFKRQADAHTNGTVFEREKYFNVFREKKEIYCKISFVDVSQFRGRPISIEYAFRENKSWRKVKIAAARNRTQVNVTRGEHSTLIQRRACTPAVSDS